MTYKSQQGIKFDRAKFLNGVRDQTKAVKSVTESTMSIVRVDVKNNTATVNVTGKFIGIVVFDNREMLMTDASASTDTWTKTASGWKLQSVVVSKEDVQMQQKK